MYISHDLYFLNGVINLKYPNQRNKLLYTINVHMNDYYFKTGWSHKKAARGNIHTEGRQEATSGRKQKFEEEYEADNQWVFSSIFSAGLHTLEPSFSSHVLIQHFKS